MPPKAKANAPSKKTEQKKKDKIIEDKTFGLKNKKGAKQQKYVQQVTKQVKDGGNKSWKQQEKEKEDQKKAKDDKKKALAEINSLFKPVQQVAKGVDPKSVLCAYFKEGTCGKGSKCKFSHDLNVQRKGEKRGIYEDEDTEPVAEGQTKIICKHFLEAVETEKFGWFWNCPDGAKCVYRHLLPKGYVLKKDMKKEEKTEEISIEDLVERERAALGGNTTKVTLETFLAWKRKKLKERAQQKEKDMAKKKSDFKSGKVISGRDLFTFNPNLDTGGLMEEDDGDFDLKNIPKDPSEEETEEGEDRFEFKEIDMDDLMSEYKDVDISAIKAAARNEVNRLAEGEAPNEVINGLDTGGAVAIDEALFDNDDDLDDLEDELEELDIS